jgi:hypothetical protein
MKTLTKFALLFTILFALAVPSTAFAKGLLDDQVVFGGEFTLRSGDVLDGNLIVFGGSVELEPGSTVDGDAVVFGGTVDANGMITGNVVGIGGPVNLGGSAVVEGDVVSVGAPVHRSPGAIVEGEVVDTIQGPFAFSFPGTVQTFPGGVQLPVMEMRFNPLVDFVWFALWVFVGTVVATLVVLFVPDHIERVAYTALNSPLPSFGIGLLTAIILPPLLIFMILLMIILIITICLLPFALLAVIFVAAVAWAFGLIALGYEVGKRLAKGLNKDWAPPLSAGIGTFLLLLVVNGLGMIPCIGWIFPALAGMLGLGAVILSRFGTQIYPESEYVSASAAVDVVDELTPSADDGDLASGDESTEEPLTDQDASTTDNLKDDSATDEGEPIP